MEMLYFEKGYKLDFYSTPENAEHPLGLKRWGDHRTAFRALILSSFLVAVTF